MAQSEVREFSQYKMVDLSSSYLAVDQRVSESSEHEMHPAILIWLVVEEETL